MKIELWADIICPWCGLGDYRLRRALEQFEHRDDVTVVHRSFQLDPRWPANVVMPARDMLMEKYGMSEWQAQSAQARVEGMAEHDGLTPYIVGDNDVGNTSLAHELLAFATSKDLHEDAWALMFRAYFAEKGDVFTVDGLVTLAMELGLYQDEARRVLEQRTFLPQVQRDFDEAREMGITGVPFYVIDDRLGISGAQEIQTLVAALRQARDESLVSASAGESAPDR